MSRDQIRQRRENNLRIECEGLLESADRELRTERPNFTHVDLRLELAQEILLELTQTQIELKLWVKQKHLKRVMDEMKRPLVEDMTRKVLAKVERGRTVLTLVKGRS